MILLEQSLKRNEQTEEKLKQLCAALGPDFFDQTIAF